jgi:RNA polymerase sigma-70 factor (ECF subfamily)
MLGSFADADDAVQDAWLRLSGADSDAIENLGGWLTTVVARVSLNFLRSRAARGESAMRDSLPDPAITAVSADLPESEALVSDAIGLALLVVLGALTPAERLSFVLHDMFRVPFDEIAPMLGATTANARQLASRARRRVRGVQPLSDPPDRARHRRLVDAFFSAARNGEFDELVRLLHPDAVLRSDFGSRTIDAPRVTRGADSIAGQAMMFAVPGAELRPVLIGDDAGVIVYLNGRATAIMAFLIRDHQILEIDAIADPDRVISLAS